LIRVKDRISLLRQVKQLGKPSASAFQGTRRRGGFINGKTVKRN